MSFNRTDEDALIEKIAQRKRELRDLEELERMEAVTPIAEVAPPSTEMNRLRLMTAFYQQEHGPVNRTPVTNTKKK